MSPRFPLEPYSDRKEKIIKNYFELNANCPRVRCRDRRPSFAISLVYLQIRSVDGNRAINEVDRLEYCHSGYNRAFKGHPSMLINDISETTAYSLRAVLVFLTVFVLIIWGFENSAWQSRQTRESQAKRRS